MSSLGDRLRALVRAPLAELEPGVRRTVRVDVSATVLLTGFTCLTGPFTGLILRRDLGASAFQLSIMASAGAAFLLLSLAWARVVEGRRPLPFVVWTGFAARALFLLVPLVHSAWAFVALLVTANLLGTIAGPANAALIARMYPKEQRGRALGLVRVAAALPGIVLVLGAGRLLALVDYDWVFPIAALLGMAASLRQRQLPLPSVPDTPQEARPALADAWRALRDDRDFRHLLAGSFVFGLGIWLQMPATPLLLADELRVTTTQVGIFAAVAAIVGMVGNACWGRLADRRSALFALRGVYLVGILTPLIYFVAASPWMLLASATTDSLMNTGLDLVWTLAVIEVAGRRRTAQYMGISATLAGVRGVIGPLIGALMIRTLGVHAVFLAAAACMTVGAWLVSRQLRVMPRTELAPLAHASRVLG